MGWAIIECPCCGARMELGKHISMQTNADRIRSMSDEELAVWLRNIRYSWTCVPRDNGNRCSDFNDDCNACWLDWLKQECES